jgi:hypothetical protein
MAYARVRRLKLNGPGRPSTEGEKATDNKIHFDTLDYAPKDATCCPSKKVATDYALQVRVGTFDGNGVRYHERS